MLALGPTSRFRRVKKVVSYVGLDSVEDSTDNPHKKRRYGSISKQGEAKQLFFCNLTESDLRSDSPVV